MLLSGGDMKEEEIAKKLYGMKLHEQWNITETLSVIRVIGGWLYCGLKVMEYVPYNNEYLNII